MPSTIFEGTSKTVEAYIFPNDEKELERLGTYEPLVILLQSVFLTNGVDLTHSMCLLVTDNKLGVAPPCQPGSTVGRVLDIGTGTGIWALDFGDEHPEAEVNNLLAYMHPLSMPPMLLAVMFEYILTEVSDRLSLLISHRQCLTSEYLSWML